MDESNSLVQITGTPKEDRVTVSTPLPLFVTKNDHVAVSPGSTSVDVGDCKLKVMFYSCTTFTVYVNVET